MLLKGYEFGVFEVINFIRDQFKGHEELLRYFENKGDIAVFGGIPRDFIFFKHYTARDIDLVVTDINNNMIDAIVNHIKNRQTRFGGFKCNINSMPVDIWTLNDTWAFKQKDFKHKIRFENLPKTVFLSIDALIVKIRTKELIDYNFQKNFEKKKIDIVFKPNPFPSLCVLRAFKYSAKYDFTFTEQLSDYVEYYLNNTYNVIEVLTKMYISHYGTLEKPITKMFPDINRFFKIT